MRTRRNELWRGLPNANRNPFCFLVFRLRIISPVCFSDVVLEERAGGIAGRRFHVGGFVASRKECVFFGVYHREGSEDLSTDLLIRVERIMVFV